MALFHVIEGAQGITHSRGLWKQVKLYRRGGYLYAAHGSGFIRVYSHGGTSLSNVSMAPENIDMDDSDFTITKDKDKWAVHGRDLLAAE